MRNLIACLAAVSLSAVCPVAVSAQAPLPTPEVEFGTSKLNLPFGETTEVLGKLSVEFTGLWLVSQIHELPDAGDEKKYYPALMLYQVSKTADGALVVNWMEYSPPAPTAEKLAEAKREQKAFAPGPDDVRAAVEALSANPPAVDPMRRAMHLVQGAGGSDPRIREDPKAKGALFSLHSVFQPSGKPVYGDSYYFYKVEANEMSGRFIMGSVPQSRGIPIPIRTEGDFRFIRVDPPKAKPPTPES